MCNACVPQVEPCCCCDYCGDQKHRPPRHICHHPFPGGVGGRGRMKGGREWEEEEGEGKAGGQMMAKWPPPWDHMRGALKEWPCWSVPLFSSLVPCRTRVSSSPFLNIPLCLWFPHISPADMKEALSSALTQAVRAVRPPSNACVGGAEWVGTLIFRWIWSPVFAPRRWRGANSVGR